MTDLNLIIITWEIALQWFVAMIICSSLMIMASTLIFSHDKRKTETKVLLGYFTNSAYIFVISGITLFAVFFIQSFGEKSYAESFTPILLFLTAGFFLIGVIVMLSGLHKLSEMYQMEESS